jgi:hypothetical protein
MFKSLQIIFHELMATRGGSNGGRRTNVQRNCFFSALTALVSSSIF